MNTIRQAPRPRQIPSPYTLAGGMHRPETLVELEREQEVAALRDRIARLELSLLMEPRGQA